MSDDLVAAVKRAYPEWRGTMCEECGLPIPICNDRALVRECDVRAERAATALTEARAEIERLRRDKSAGFAFWRSIAKRFCNARKAALDRAIAAESELSTLRARVREVVGPFSRLCEMHVDDDTKDSSGIIFPASRAVVQAGHLRAARQLNEDLK